MTADAERLAAIRESLSEITPGPWEIENATIWGNGHARQSDWTPVARMSGSRAWSNDAEFIAAAPETIAYLLTVAAERDAEKERADKAEAMLRLANRNTERRGKERDALRARIEAALAHAFEHQDSNGGWPHVVALMHAALAGDQPEAAPGRPRPVWERCSTDLPALPAKVTPEPADRRRIARRGDQVLHGVAVASDQNGPYRLMFQADGIPTPVLLDTAAWRLEWEDTPRPPRPVRSWIELDRDAETGAPVYGWSHNVEDGSVVHRCPVGSSVMPCCGRLALEAIGARITLYPELVTCRPAEDGATQ